MTMSGVYNPFIVMQYACCWVGGVSGQDAQSEVKFLTPTPTFQIFPTPTFP